MKSAVFCLLAVAPAACVGELDLDAEPDTGSTTRPLTRADVAARFAPHVYQDLDDAYPVGDAFTEFDFDGDDVGKNNRENQAGRDTAPAYVYASVSETEFCRRGRPDVRVQVWDSDAGARACETQSWFGRWPWRRRPPRGTSSAQSCARSSTW